MREQSLNIALDVDSTLDIGEYNVTIEDIYMTNASYETIHPLKETSVITIKDAMLGDANNDDVVNVTDAIGIVNHILNNTPTSFSTDAADVNEDGVINVTDAIGVVNMILNSKSSVSNNKTDIENVPQ